MGSPGWPFKQSVPGCPLLADRRRPFVPRAILPARFRGWPVASRPAGSSAYPFTSMYTRGEGRRAGAGELDVYVYGNVHLDGCRTSDGWAIAPLCPTPAGTAGSRRWRRRSPPSAAEKERNSGIRTSEIRR